MTKAFMRYHYKKVLKNLLPNSGWAKAMIKEAEEWLEKDRAEQLAANNKKD